MQEYNNYNIIDITDEVDDLPKVLKIKDKEFEVNEDRKVVHKALANIKIAGINKKKGLDVDEDKLIDETITYLLGEDALKEIEELHLTDSGYQKVFLALIATVKNIPLEELKAQTGDRFRK